jgi:hypothetical protein
LELDFKGFGSGFIAITDEFFDVVGTIGIGDGGANFGSIFTSYMRICY